MREHPAYDAIAQSSIGRQAMAEYHQAQGDTRKRLADEIAAIDAELEAQLPELEAVANGAQADLAEAEKAFKAAQRRHQAAQEAINRARGNAEARQRRLRIQLGRANSPLIDPFIREMQAVMNEALGMNVTVRRTPTETLNPNGDGFVKQTWSQAPSIQRRYQAALNAMRLAENWRHRYVEDLSTRLDDLRDAVDCCDIKTEVIPS